MYVIVLWKEWNSDSALLLDFCFYYFAVMDCAAVMNGSAVVIILFCCCCCIVDVWLEKRGRGEFVVVVCCWKELERGREVFCAIVV